MMANRAARLFFITITRVEVLKIITNQSVILWILTETIILYYHNLTKLLFHSLSLLLLYLCLYPTQSLLIRLGLDHPSTHHLNHRHPKFALCCVPNILLVC